MPNIEIDTGTPDKFPIINWDDFEIEDDTNSTGEILN